MIKHKKKAKKEKKHDMLYKKIKKHEAKKKEESKEDRYFISYVPEIKLLEKGHMPSETKMGTEFKGKNKILIS